MIFKLLKYTLSPVLIILLTFSISYSQKDTGKNKVSQNEKAMSYFIEGKSLELQNNFIGAVENFRDALKYDKAPGIYHALAQVYFKQGKMDEAKNEIKKALKIQPYDQNYLETLADINIVNKDFKDAVENYEEIIRLDSNYTYGLYSLARLYQELKMTSKSIIIYEKITNMIGYDFDVLNKMYEIYINYKNYDKAIETLEALQKLDPFNVNIKSLLASLYVRTNRNADARRIYEEMYMLNPDNKEIQTELVKIYFRQNESDRAFENFSKMLGKDSLDFLEKVQVGELYYNLISQDESAKDISKNIFIKLNKDYPQEWIPYYYLGIIDILDKDISGYKEKFLKSIEYADTSSDAYVNIGLALFQQNDTEEALKTLDEGLSKFNNDFRLLYVKGLTLQRIDRVPEAITYFEKAIEINPNDVSMLSTLALAYDGQGNFMESAEIYEKALKIDPQNALVLNNYAYNLSERGVNLDKALEMSKISIEKDPGNASFLDTIGWIYFKLKKYKPAKENIERSLMVNPNSAVVLEHLGDIYNAMKDYPGALKYWKLSLEKNPNNVQLKEKIDLYKIS